MCVEGYRVEKGRVSKGGRRPPFGGPKAPQTNKQTTNKQTNQQTNKQTILVLALVLVICNPMGVVSMPQFRCQRRQGVDRGQSSNASMREYSYLNLWFEGT